MLLRVISLVNLFALHEVVMSNKKKVGKSCDLGVIIIFFFFCGGGWGSLLIHVILELMLQYYFFLGMDWG